MVKSSLHKMIKRFLEWIESAEIGRLRHLIVIIIFLFVWGLMTHKKISGDGDEPHYMMIAYSLVFDRDLDLSNNYGDKRNIVFDGNLEEVPPVKGKNGKLYPDHDIGMPLLFAPYFAVAYLMSDKLCDFIPKKILRMSKMNKWGLLKALLGFLMVFLTGVLAVYIFDICYYLTGEKSKSFLWAIFSACSPPILSHSFLFYTEILTALIAVYCYKKLITKESLSTLNYFSLGGLISYLFLIHVRNIGIILALLIVLGIHVLKQERPARILSCFFVAFSIPLIFRTLLNYQLWGTLLFSQHDALRSPLPFIPLVKEIVIRLFGLLFDQEGGLFIYAPIYILSFAGFALLFKKSKQTFFELFLIFFINYFLIVSFPLWNKHGWTGFWSPASRYLVPAVPFLSIATFFTLAEYRTLPFIIKSLGMLQLILDLFFWQFPKLLWNDGDGVSSFLLFLGGGSNYLVNLFPSWNFFSIRSLLLSVGLLCFALSITIVLLKKIKDPYCANGSKS